MSPTPPLPGFAAGAAWGAAKDAGLGPLEQAHVAAVAAEEEEKQRRAETQEPPRERCKPVKEHGPGWALRIARWLNLR